MTWKVGVICLVFLCGCESIWLEPFGAPEKFLFSKAEKSIQSKECNNILNKIPLNGSLPRWALQMIDSSGTISSGILAGNILSLGDYDQCISIHDESGIDGKYCLMVYQHTKNVATLHGICIPTVCNIGALLPINSGGLWVRDDLCQTDAVQLDGGDIFCIVVIAGSLFWVGVATVYDLLKRKHDSEDVNKIILSFSIYTNTINLFKNQPHKLSSINGIRVLSVLWIMYANCASIMTSIPATNALELYNKKISNNSNYIYAATFVIDTFFYLSGFLLAYNTLKNSKEAGVILNIPQFIYRRWLRLFPTLAFLYLIVTTIARRVGSGPLYQLATETAMESCLQHTWAYFFFLQNYLNHNDMCIPHTWFLSAAMQLHVLSICVLIPLGWWMMSRKLFRIQMMFIGLVFIFSVITMIVTASEINSNIYATHSRVTVFLIGIYAGSNAISLDKYMKKLNKILCSLIWLVILSTMGYIAFSGRFLIQQHNSPFSIALETVGRPLWGIGLTWIIFNCMTGRSELLNRFLSLPAFEVMSRLSFAICIVSYLEIGYHAVTLRNSIYLSHIYLIQTWISDVFITLVFAYLWTMLFELPYINLKKVISGINYKKVIDINKRKTIVV